MKSRIQNNTAMRSTRRKFTVNPEHWSSHDALELEAAAALLMLRYQYDITIGVSDSCTVPQTSTPPTPPPPAPAAGLAVTNEMPVVEAVFAAPEEMDKSTPKEQVRSSATMAASSQPLKKRSIPAHLLRRSLTPARSTIMGSSVNTSNSSNSSVLAGGITKPNLKLPPAQCNKALLKSCRNMIREFLDNQELI